MKEKGNSRIRFYFFLALAGIVVLAVLSSIFTPTMCNIRREYKSSQDLYIKDIKNKITDLEKDNIKDATTMKRLAEQYNLLGMYYLDKRMWDMAIDAFTSSMKYGNSGAPAFYSIGLAYANRGNEKNSQDDLSRAESNYRKAIEISRNYADAKYALSILLFYHKNGKDEAQSLLHEIIAANKSYYPARFALGRFNYELGYREKALTIYQELASDLDRLPPSELVKEYKENCKNNITRIQMELSGK
jgi:tetratricopeptide (TPR) repeat protein